MACFLKIMWKDTKEVNIVVKGPVGHISMHGLMSYFLRLSVVVGSAMQWITMDCMFMWAFH